MIRSANLHPRGLARMEGLIGVAGGIAPIITQLTPATFGPYTAGQTPAAAYTAGTYASSAGTISTITPVWTKNGGAATGATVLAAGDVVGLTVNVVDSAANTRGFGYGTKVVGADPALIVSGVTLSGGKLNMSVSASATMYYLASYSATQMTGAAIKAAVIATTPDVYGSFAYVSPTPVDEAIDLTPMTAGTVYLHVAGDDGTTVVAATPYGFTYTPP